MTKETSIVIHNLVVCLLIVFVTWYTGSAWSIAGLLFMINPVTGKARTSEMADEMKY